MFRPSSLIETNDLWRTFVTWKENSNPEMLEKAELKSVTPLEIPFMGISNDIAARFFSFKIPKKTYETTAPFQVHSNCEMTQ